MRFDYYRDTMAEQETWRRLGTEQRMNASAAEQITPDVAARLTRIHQLYPWIAAAQKIALAKANLSDEAVDLAAMGNAQAKGQGRTTSGVRQMWSQPGDTIG